MPHDDPSDPSHHHAPSAHATIAVRRYVAARSAKVGKPVHDAGHSTLPSDTRLHLDCFSGLSGDMIVGALLDLGGPFEVVESALRCVALEGYAITAHRVDVSSIACTRFVVEVEPGHPQRSWRDIRALIENSSLSDEIRRGVLLSFSVLAEAEARVHRVEVDDVHFHEVGAVDSIVDIVAASALFDYFGAKVTCAPLPMGRGFARTDHGIIPLPAPAVLEVLQGAPTYDAGIEGELVTPTGAALVRAFVQEFLTWPPMGPVRTGFGAGTRSLADRPNALRVILARDGEARADNIAEPSTSHVVIETNIDDASSETIALACAELLRAGALDVWTEAITMKKSRQATKLSALVAREDADRIARVVLRETTSLGVRFVSCSRLERPRRMVEVQTQWGSIRCKIADEDDLPPVGKPEDDDVAAVARAAQIPARVVRETAHAALQVLIGTAHSLPEPRAPK
ncbi:MAG: nickel pincer cofactor biosynthesis protein LarC [Deltaproteobacteria bacterium]|nr:nickel pincer cofactor biosynthesis protein LarC [Deltaproteobacteria bacterium]